MFLGTELITLQQVELSQHAVSSGHSFWISLLTNNNCFAPARRCLQEVGIDPASPRHTWPLPKLVRVLHSMQQSGEGGRDGRERRRSSRSVAGCTGLQLNGSSSNGQQ